MQLQGVFVVDKWVSDLACRSRLWHDSSVSPRQLHAATHISPKGCSAAVLLHGLVTLPVNNTSATGNTSAAGTRQAAAETGGSCAPQPGPAWHHARFSHASALLKLGQPDRGAAHEEQHGRPQGTTHGPDSNVCSLQQVGSGCQATVMAAGCDQQQIKRLFQLSGNLHWLRLNPSGVQGVANRDLKLENLLVVKREGEGARPLLKICDFGFSKVGSGSSALLLALPTPCTAARHSARNRSSARRRL